MISEKYIRTDPKETKRNQDDDLPTSIRKVGTRYTLRECEVACSTGLNDRVEVQLYRIRHKDDLAVFIYLRVSFG